MRVFFQRLLCVLSVPVFVMAQGGAAQRVTPPPAGTGFGCAPRPVAMPTFSHAVNLSSWIQCGGAATPFGMAYTEDGSRAYASLFGGNIGNGGCVVVRLDPDTLQVIGTITTGMSPEEIAFATWPDGSFRYGFVTDSSSSTVTVFDTDDQVVATIPIPFLAQATYPTAFPYGLATHPAQTRVYVGTGDGQGFVHAIDVETLTLDPFARIELGADHGMGRLGFVEDRLVIPATQYLPNFSGSTAKVMVVDPALPTQVDELVLASHSSGLLYPALQEMVVDCNGRVWVAGFDLGARVFAIDPEGPTLLRSIPTRTAQANGKFQAMGLSADGMLWVADLWTAELSLIDVRREHWIRTIDSDVFPASLQGPHEVTFHPDGSKAVVLWAATENLTVLDL